jgi:hypothetical protein
MTGAPFTGPSGPGGHGAIAGGTVQSLSCPSCGSAIALRGMGWTQTVACASCGSVLDARDPSLSVLHRYGKAVHTEPLIPLGTRGQWRGAPYEVIGFQVRRVLVDGAPYSWREYLLFNPYHGFRYLTEYDGHWNDVVTVHGLPVSAYSGGKPAMTWSGRTYRHFQTAEARTTYVLGEFPWEVREHDSVVAKDYVAPPRMLSSEEDGTEITWSEGEYVDPKEIWRAFKRPGGPPPARGVFANQPNPAAGRAGSIWGLCFILVLALLGLGITRLVTARNDRIELGTWSFTPGQQAMTAFTTPSFDLRGDRANVQVLLQSNLHNNWMYMHYALVNEITGQVFDFGREVSAYSGTDSDGAWSEGSPRDEAKVGGVPGGRYFLRVEPEGPAEGGLPVQYSLRLQRDAPSFLYFFIGMLLLLVPPIAVALHSASFETKRWAESDHAPVASSDDDEDGDE